MDDDLLKLEAELKHLRPAAPSARLLEQISRDLPARRDWTRSMRITTWLSLPVAAALAIIIATQSTPPEGKSSAAVPSATPTFKPVASENLLVRWRDEGYVTLADGTPARRVRQTYLDTITWKNPKTNASLTWRLPREEVRVLPLILQ